MINTLIQKAETINPIPFSAAQQYNDNKDKHPFFLAVSIGIPFNIDCARQIIATIKETPSLRDTRIMLGGQCFSMTPHLKDRIQADGGGTTARDAVLLAEEWWGNA